MTQQESKPDRDRPPLADTEAGKKISRAVVDKTGYDPVDLLNSPVKPPELKNVRRNFSALQFSLIITGAIIAAIGLIIWIVLLSGAIGFVVMAIGAACIVIGTLVRI